MTEHYETLELRRDKDLLWLVLNRPASLNAGLRPGFGSNGLSAVSDAFAGRIPMPARPRPRPMPARTSLRLVKSSSLVT